MCSRWRERPRVSIVRQDGPRRACDVLRGIIFRRFRPFRKTPRTIHRLLIANNVVICAMFFASPGAALCIAEQPFKNARRTFNLGPDASLQAFDLVEYRVKAVTQVKFPTPTGLHRDMPAY